MSDQDARQIFDQLVAYPLPSATGVRDYVFYCGALGSYGAEARKLFDRQWPAHVARTAATLQDLMATLQAEVASGSVTQIRELVIVAHGNANQLFFPVVPAAPGVDPVYGCVTAWSLAALQDDIEGRFASFDQARKAVVARLLEDSWVTIRACNIGSSAEAMYALHAFFGGRADVYAPTKYMVFADCPIAPGNRIQTKFGVYDYLVKQHFLTSDEHTPRRRAAIVSDLVDPESFSAPFSLATAQMAGGTGAGAQAYQQLVDELDHYRVSPALQAAFAAGGHPLSPAPQVVSAADTAIDAGATPPGPRSVWYVRDTTMQDAGVSVDLVYQIRDETDGAGTSTLEANAQLAVASAYPSVPFQLFFDQDDDDAFNGVIARLAGYADEGRYAGAEFKAAFDAVRALLDAGSWTDGTNDISTAIANGLGNAELDPLPDPLPAIGPGGGAGTWTIATTPPLTVAVEVVAAPDGFPLHSLVVRAQLDADALAARRLDMIARRGRVPHTPGTEIAAYLDRFTADQLAGLIDHLRRAYRPAYAYHIDHALAAIERKRDFGTWAAAQPDHTDPLPAHLMLRPNENDDLRAVAFPFDFDDNWREVKQHSPFVGSFQSDLFAEESLTDKLKLTGTWTCGVLPPDSRYVSRDELRAQQSQGHEQYFATAPSKTVWEPPVAPVDQGCADFRAALEKWKELRDSGAAPDVIEHTLEELVGSDGLSFYERMKETLEPVHMGTELWDIAFDSKIEYRVFVSEFLEKRIETEWLSEAFGVTGEILEIAAPMTIAFELWLPTAEAQEEASEHWDAIGQVVAMRQWLRRLIDLTNQAPFPDELHIDIGGADQAVDAWIAEQQAEHPMFDILTHPLETDLVDGYARAAVSFARIGPQVVEQADKYVSEKIAESGLSPCSIKAMTDVGLLDLDQLRRKVIRAFAEAVRDSLPRV